MHDCMRMAEHQQNVSDVQNTALEEEATHQVQHGLLVHVPMPEAIDDQQSCDQFWQRCSAQVARINDSHDFKYQELPLARIKKIMKLDEDVKMISAEAPVVFAKACEFFIEELTLRAWAQTEESKRRTLQRSDVAAAVSKCDQFDFLIDIVPREEAKPLPSQKKDHQPQHTCRQESPPVQFVVQVPQGVAHAGGHMVQQVAAPQVLSSMPGGQLVTAGGGPQIVLQGHMPVGSGTSITLTPQQVEVLRQHMEAAAAQGGGGGQQIILQTAPPPPASAPSTSGAGQHVQPVHVVSSSAAHQPSTSYQQAVYVAKPGFVATNMSQ